MGPLHNSDGPTLKMLVPQSTENHEVSADYNSYSLSTGHSQLHCIVRGKEEYIPSSRFQVEETLDEKLLQLAHFYTRSWVVHALLRVSCH